MKRNYFTRMVIPVIGIAFGFFFGCSSVSNVNETQNESTLSEKQLKQRLQQIEDRISENPDNSEAYYQKGDVLYSLAQKQAPPENRVSYYRNMQNALVEAGNLYESSGNETGSENVDELLQVSWSFEHNRGVELMQADSTLTNDSYAKAASHFNNAITIIPDSVVSYKMKARALYRGNRAEQAIQTLETARSQIDNLPSAQLEQLAFLYLETNQHKKAVELYEEAETFSDNNLNLLHGLANAYIMAGRHKEAVNLLSTLVENEPENIIYLESHATELYQLGIQHYNSLDSISESDSLALQQTKAEADTLLNMAENQLKKILQQNPDDVDIKEQLARIYKNHAVHLSQIKPLFSQNKQSDIEEEVVASLSNAVTLFEELAENQPQDSRYWKNLYQAYSYLGMQEEANEAKAKANL
ncbi:MAG: tetratricopeptide repeat protein [Balneolaceae bacterium]|nr:tetratricopeptide repeat protein [Balneolaceae bacterium]